MRTNQTDVVTDYLREVDQRLAGLPVLQRRELLADLAAHIAAEPAERNLTDEGQVIEVLERLGSPEAIAAAAHEEAGTRPAPPTRRRPMWPIAVAAGVLLVLVLLCGFAFFAQSSSESVPTPAEPTPAATSPQPPAPTVTG